MLCLAAACLGLCAFVHSFADPGDFLLVRRSLQVQEIKLKVIDEQTLIHFEQTRPESRVPLSDCLALINPSPRSTVSRGGLLVLADGQRLPGEPAAASFLPMCRNIRVLHHFVPPTTEAEIRDAALQFVRKVSGIHKPSQADLHAFDHAVDDIMHATAHLLEALQAKGTPRTREGEKAKGRGQNYAAGTPTAVDQKRPSLTKTDKNKLLLGDLSKVPFQELYELLARCSPAEIASLAEQLQERPRGSASAA